MKFLSRRPRAGTPKAASDLQERRLARELGGRTTPGSGAGGMKGDVRTPDEMIEAKTTSKRQFILKLDALEKLETEARASGKQPVLIVQFADSERPFLHHREWVVLPKQDYLALRDKEET